MYSCMNSVTWPHSPVPASTLPFPISLGHLKESFQSTVLIKCFSKDQGLKAFLAGKWGLRNQSESLLFFVFLNAPLSALLVCSCTEPQTLASLTWPYLHKYKQHLSQVCIATQTMPPKSFALTSALWKSFVFKTKSLLLQSIDLFSALGEVNDKGGASAPSKGLFL